MRFSATLALAVLSVSNVASALPTAAPEDLALVPVSDSEIEAKTLPLGVHESTIETRANTPADVKKHDNNHAKLAKGNCGQGCKSSLSSYHSQASKDSKASKASKASQASKNGKKNGPRGVPQTWEA